jgi:hypothetical protein
MYDRSASGTVCAACANLIVPDGAAKRFYHWLCAARKWDAVWNPVTGQSDLYPPYHYCCNVNAGDCPHYAPGPNSLKPRATQDGEIV